MDPLSHALTGAVLASALAPHGRLRFAALSGAVLATAPDLDVLIKSAADPLLNVEMHRHFTHSIVFAAGLAAVAAALMARVSDAGVWRWFAALLPAALSAGLLDACTSYGTELLWPLADTRVAWAVIAVVDPIYTLILALSMTWVVWRQDALVATAGIVLGAAYLSAGSVQHLRADWALASLAESRGHAVEHHVVKPTLGNLLVWRGVYVADGEIFADAYRLGASTVAYPGRHAPRVTPRSLALPEGSRVARDAARFTRLSDGFLVRHPRHEHVYGDARYAMMPDDIAPMFAVRLDPSAPAAPAAFLELRERPAEAWRRFKAMLGGESLPRLPGTGDR